MNTKSGTTERPKKRAIRLLLTETLKQKVREMATYFEKTDAQIIRDSIMEMYSDKYRKSAFGYQAGAITAAGRLGRIEKREEQEALLKSFNDMSDEAFLNFLIECKYIEQDIYDNEFKQYIHYEIIADPNTGKKDLYRDRRSDVTKPENVNFCEDFDVVIKNVVKEKRI